MPSATSWFSELSSTTRMRPGDRCPAYGRLRGRGDRSSRPRDGGPSAAPGGRRAPSCAPAWPATRRFRPARRPPGPSGGVDVSMIMRVSRRSGRRRSAWRARSPSTSGMHMSRTAMSYGTPARPWPAAPTGHRGRRRRRRAAAATASAAPPGSSGWSRCRRPPAPAGRRAGRDPVPAGRSTAGVAASQRDLEPEGAAAARLAVHPDLSAHRLDQPARDGEPETGTAVAAGRRRVGLGERLEQPTRVLRRRCRSRCR